MTDTTTRNLAREVAVALGWSVYKRVESFTFNDLYMLVAPHPEREYTLSDYTWLIRAGGDYACRKTEAEAWQDAPNYPNDLNACARDLTRDGWELVIHQRNHASRGKWFAQYINDNTINAFTGWADSPAVAWCEAFLALCKHVDGQGGEGRIT